MTELLELQLGAGDEITFSNSEKLTYAPEPASMALLGVGLLGLGFVAKLQAQRLTAHTTGGGHTGCPRITWFDWIGL